MVVVVVCAGVVVVVVVVLVCDGAQYGVESVGDGVFLDSDSIVFGSVIVTYFEIKGLSPSGLRSP